MQKFLPSRRNPVGWVVAGAESQQSSRSQLSYNMPEVSCRVVASDAMDRQLIMAALDDLAGPRPSQNVYDVPRTEALPRADDRGQYLLGYFCNVCLVIACQADVARPAILFAPLLAEVREYRAASADRALAEVDHLPELQFRLPALGRVLDPVYEVVVVALVAVGVEQNALAWQTVASRPPRLLIVALNGFRERVMDDEAHVRLVDAHTKRDGSGDDLHVVPDEPLLRLPTHSVAETGMVRQGVDPVRSQVASDPLGLLPGETVDDCRLAAVVPQQT